MGLEGSYGKLANRTLCRRMGLERPCDLDIGS
jgi:hypothetical protein